MSQERLLLITGRLAEPALRQVVAQMQAERGLSAEIEVLNITVAALLHTDWIARRLEIRGRFDRVIVPGWCGGDLRTLREKFGVPFERGPKDLYDLPEFLGEGPRTAPDLSQYDIEIIAEINHAPRWEPGELMAEAIRLRESGADAIDVGCIPGERWPGVGDCVRRLREADLRVSIDSFDRDEVEAAVGAGAELVLSCNSANREWAAGLGTEVVAIPDTPSDCDSLAETVAFLRKSSVPFRIDPVLEPIGFGFAASLQRYARARADWPDCEIMMGVGNLTELSEVDSAGVNFLLAALCQEWGVRSVLTTQVINWCRTAVAEFDFARRLIKYAIDHGVLPKHLDSSLVALRDPKLHEAGDETLRQLAERIRDANFRIFAERGKLHVVNRDGCRSGTDPFALFDEIAAEGKNLSASHAFYLGYEMCKAVTALTLGKQYRQDEPLDWGFLTVPEISAVARRKRRGEDGQSPD